PRMGRTLTVHLLDKLGGDVCRFREPRACSPRRPDPGHPRPGGPAQLPPQPRCRGSPRVGAPREGPHRDRRDPADHHVGARPFRRGGCRVRGARGAGRDPRRRRPAGTGPLAFGSFAFSGASPAGGVLIVPKVILGRDDEGAWLTTISAGGLTPLPAPADLLRDVEAELPEVSVEFSSGSLGRAEWLRQVDQVMGRIRAGEAGKVVLARDAIADLSGPGDARRVLRALSEEYASCWA